MASNLPQPQAGSSSSTTEHSVRVPKDNRKIYKMMKFSSGNDVDFVKLSQTPVRMERENNFKEYKTANNIDEMPKFGAGSEFGREQKEIARKKKYGVMMKNYNPSGQPWILKIGKNKEVKRYKGVREGTITENTSYYIFTQCSDGAFDAFPVEEWYNFSPMIRYKYLNSDEAEEEFSRRDKTLNYFSIMVRKRCRNDEEPDKGADDGEDEKVKTSKKKKDLVLTDMDEWFDISEDENDDNEEDGDEDSKSKKGKKLPKKVKKKRNAKHNSDDEAIEESDDGDYDDREVDYISDSGSSSEEEGAKKDKYEEKGVDEEKGLKKLIDSGDESEEEEEKKQENNEKEEKTKKGAESDSSSSSSAEDSDMEKDENVSSAIFLQKSEAKRNSPVPRSETPSSMDTEEKKSSKRKHDSEMPSSKKMRTDSPSAGSSKDGITESAIRRYLTRKPMTPKELMLKFKAKKLNISKDQMTSAIAQLLKKINPEKKIINKVMYLSLKAE